MENKVSAVRLTVFMGAGSRDPLKSYSFQKLLKIFRKTSFCELQTTHHTLTCVITCHIEKACITNTTDMKNLVNHCKGRKRRKLLGNQRFWQRERGPPAARRCTGQLRKREPAAAWRRTGQSRTIDFHVGDVGETSATVRRCVLVFLGVEMI